MRGLGRSGNGPISGLLRLPEEAATAGIGRLASVRWSLLLTALMLSVVGAATVHSASAAMPTEYLGRQLAWIAAGLVVFLVTFSLDYQRVALFALPFYLACMVSLVLVMLVGQVRGGARSWFGVGSFGVQPSETVEQWADGMDVLAKALTQEWLEHDGPVWKIPPRELVPKCVTEPHPPVSLAASSVSSHVKAGERGIGAICFENYFGFDYLQECIDAYRDGLTRARPDPLQLNDYMGLYVATAFCAETREEAKQIARDVALEYFQFILDLYIPLGKTPAYRYLAGRIDALTGRTEDLDFLCTETPSVMIGTPGDFVERLRRLESMGVDEVVMRVDGVAHDDILRSLELIGHEVIPAVDPAATVVR